MFVVNSLPVAIAFCIVTMLGWGSWANTQKLAGKEKWPFQLFYWDYGIGVLLLGIVFSHTLGSMGTAGMGAIENMHGGVEWRYVGLAAASGAIFNLSNLLLVVGIDAAGMSVAFPVGVGLALVIGTVATYLGAPKGNPALLFGGVALIVFAMLMSAKAHSLLPRKTGTSALRGVAYSAAAGVLMGFYPLLMGAISPDFNSKPIAPGLLTPYVALFFFGVGVFLSNFAWNAWFMRLGGMRIGAYFKGSARLHLIGILGGAIWMLALSFNVIASGVAGPAISYALGQGATLVAALWGIFIWHEFRDAPAGTGKFLALMLAGYTGGLLLIGAATQ